MTSNEGLGLEEAKVVEGAPKMFTKELAEMFERAKTTMNEAKNKQEDVTIISKGITWESKKIIQTVQTFVKRERVLGDCKQRLNNLLKSEKHFVGMARVLDGEDKALHYRRYSHCVQEYLEAVLFHAFVEQRKLPTYQDIRKKFIFEVGVDDSECIATTSDPSNTMEDVDRKIFVVDGKKFRRIEVPVKITDYVLAIADFTGEIMRATTLTVTIPRLHLFLYQAFALVREIYYQLSGVTAYNREFAKKMKEMESSVIKIETTVYKLKMKVLLFGRLPTENELRSLQPAFLKLSEKDCDDSGLEYD